MVQSQRPRRRTAKMRMELGGWQPIVELPKQRVQHERDPIAYLMLPLLGYLLVCAAVAAVLVREIGPIFPW